jgi:hypothetical protein
MIQTFESFYLVCHFEVGYQFNNMNNKFVRSSQESFPTFDGGQGGEFLFTVVALC